MDLSNLVQTPLDQDPNQQQKPYWQVLQEHQQALKDYPELAGTTVQEFAQNMGPGYETGLGPDNALRRGSGNIDIALHHFGGGSPGYTGPTLSETLGGPQEGWDLPALVQGGVEKAATAAGASPELTTKLGQVGAGFPRMAVDIGAGGALGGIPGIAAMSAESTYGETGSKLQAGISGLGALLIPKAAEKVSGAFMRAAGAKTLAETSPDLLQKATRLLTPEAGAKLGTELDPNILQKLAGVAGAQVGMFGVGEATEAAENLTGDDKLARLQEQFSPSSLVATGFAQLPWTAYDLARTKSTNVSARDKEVLDSVKGDFAQRYVKEAIDLGQTPTVAQVKRATNVVMSGKPAQGDMFYSPEGQVLKSMGQLPIQLDLTRPIRTNTGDWPIQDAIDRTKAVANSITNSEFDRFDDQRVTAALKAVEMGGGGKLDKDETSRQAALRVIDTMTHDNEDLYQISPDYAELGKQELKDYGNEVKRNSKDAEIARKTNPTLFKQVGIEQRPIGKTNELNPWRGNPIFEPTDEPNPEYDPETAKRMSLLSGDTTERQAAGATPRTDLFAEPKQPITIQFPGKNGRTLVIQDSILEQISRDLSGNPSLRSPLLGTATQAARRAADDYAGKVDTNDPASLGKFYNYIKKAVIRAQLGFARIRGPEVSVRDNEGNIVYHDTQEQATQRATELNADNTDDTTTFETRKEPNGKFTVAKVEYIRQLSSAPSEVGGREAGVEVGQEARFEPPEGMGVEEEEGIPKKTVDQFGEGAEKNMLLEQFHAMSEQRDPAVRQARLDAMAQNAIDFVKGMPDSKILELLLKGTEGKNVPSLTKAAERKALFVKIMKFLRDGGDLNIKVTPTGKETYTVKGRGNLAGLNTYLGEHGFKDPNALNAPKMRGLSVFEQFHVLAKYLATEFINPNKIVDFTQRPRGDFAWMPAGAFPDDVEHKLLVKWPKEYPKAMQFTPSEHQAAPETVLKLQNRQGGEQRLEVKYPLADLFVKATKHQLTISAGELHDMFKRYVPGADPNLMSLLKSFVSQPFGSTIRIGFGIAKDAQTKGYYHLDDLLSGTGILLSPFSETNSPRHIRSVDRPEEVLPHLVHELAHAHTIFGYHNDPTIKAEVDQVWKQISDQHKAAVGVGAQGKFTVDNMHSLDSPEEMLASVFNDGLLHEYLKSIPDSSPRGGRVQQFNSVFDHIMDIIRRVFEKIVGPEGANTMLSRVTDLARRTMESQESLREEKGFDHEGDIYSATDQATGKPLVGDLIYGPKKAKTAPVGGEQAQVYPLDNERAQNERRGKLFESRATGKTFIDKDGVEKFETIIRPAVKDSNGDIFVGYHHPEATLKLMNYKKVGGFEAIKGAKKGFVTNSGRFISEEEIEKLGESTSSEDRPELENARPLSEAEEAGKEPWTLDQMKEGGQLLQSRVPKQPLLDSMKAASEYVTEDNMGQWFKPLSVSHFQRVFGPIFGGRLTMEEQGGQQGFRASPVAFSNITDADMARAPKPPIKPWAVSVFEMMKRGFLKSGESDQNAEALAGYNMSMASLLRGSEQAIWGTAVKKGETQGSNLKLLGVALTPERIGALTQAGITREQVGSTLRHEQTHLTGFVDTNLQIPADVRESIRNVNDTFASLSPEERDVIVTSLTNVTNHDRVNSREGVYDLAKTDPNEFASEFMGHVGQTLGNVPDKNAYLRDVLRFVPDELSSLLLKTTLRRSQALDALQENVAGNAYLRGIKNNRVPGLLGEVDTLAQSFKAMGREALDIAIDQADFYRMRALYPDMYQKTLLASSTAVSNTDRAGYLLQSRVPQIFKEVKNFMGLDQDDRLPTKPGFWSKYLTQFSQFAAKYPIARPFYDMLSSADELAHQGFMQMRSVLAGGTGDPGSLLDKQVTKNLGKFLKSPQLQQYFDRIALDVQTEGDQETKRKLAAANGDVMQVQGDVDVMTPQYMDALYRKYGVSTTDRPVIENALNGVRNQIKLGSVKMVAAKLEELHTLTAKAIVMNTNLGPEQARELGKQLVDAVRAVDGGDVQKAIELHKALEQAITDPAVQAKLLDFAESGWNQTKRLERFLSIRMPYFMSERRFGDYGLWWKEGGKVVSHYFKNGGERSKFIVSKNIDPIRQTDPDDKNFGVSSGVFSGLDEIQARNLENLKALFGEQEGQRIAGLTDVSTALRQEMQSQDLTKALAPRKGAFSRKYLSMFDTQQQFVGALINSIKNKQIRLESELLFSHPQFANQPMIRSVVQKHIDASLIPDNPIGRAISQANFVYFLGGNPSSIIMQSFHQLMGLAPTLVENGATVAGSYGLILKANKLYHEAHKLGAGSGQYNDPQINDLVNQYRQGGGIQLGITSELDYDQDLALVNRLRVGGGQGEFSGFDLLKNRAYQGMSLLRRMYNVVPHYNNEIAFVASLLHLRERNPGISNDRLYSDARFMKDNAMYPGGKSNRPGLFSVLPRSAAQSVWSLQTYANGLTTLMGNLIRKSFVPKGVTPAQATQARKAAVQMMTTQMVFAGALGFPFANAMLLALSKIFPDHNVEKDVRDVFAQLGGDDEALGGWLSTAMTTGIPSAMSYAPDVGSRFALSGALKVSPYSGLEVADLAGPVGGLATNVFKAIQAGAEGKPLKSAEDIMPNGMKRIFQSLEQGSTYVSQGSGNMLADDLTPIEQISRAIGFTPSRVARIMEAQHLKKVSEDVEKEDRSKFADQQASEMIKGNDQAVHQAIMQKSAESGGVHKPEELARAVTKRVQERTTPIDPRTYGSRDSVETNRSLKGALGEQTPGPSNTDRILQQQQLARRLGFFHAAPSSKSVGHAIQLDRLLELYPSLSRPQAALLLNHATSASPIAQELTGAGE